MIIELIGPKGIGKSTVAPLVAERLGINHYLGQAFHDLDGNELSTLQEWADRALSVARNPGLAVEAMGARNDTVRAGLRFALNACRRDRFAARAAQRGSGVIESGPLNSLIQASASYRRNLTALHSRIFTSDIYVRLMSTADEVARRLRNRGGVSESRIAEHHGWVARYEAAADGVLDRVPSPVLEIDASAAADQLAGSIAVAVENIPTIRSDRTGN